MPFFFFFFVMFKSLYALQSLFVPFSSLTVSCLGCCYWGRGDQSVLLHQEIIVDMILAETCNSSVVNSLPVATFSN